VIPLVLLIMFGASCLLLIVDGLKRRGGIYEFSFLAGAGLFGLLFAQAVGIVRNPDMAPEAGVCKALIMATLCAAAIYFGWKAPVRKPHAGSHRLPFSEKWLYRIGVACVILGAYGTVKMAGLTGGVMGLTAVQGRHQLVWHGLPVMYTFFEWYSYLGLVLVASVALRLRSWLLGIPAAVPFLVSLGNIVLSGRRSESIMLVLILGCALYFGRNVAPPRAAALALAPFAVLAMFLAPAYRSRTTSGRWGQLNEISTSDTMRHVFSGSEGEFWSMAYLMEITDTEGLYQYGIGFYNVFVADYVPKLIVGEDFKEKLFVTAPTAQNGENRLGWVIPLGMVPTGPFSVFAQFWYFGAVCFYFLAKWLKGHWIRALAGDFWSQVVYAVAVTFAISAVTNDFFSIYNALFVFILPVKLLTGISGSMRRMAEPYSLTAPLRPRPSPQPQSPAKV
jgi:hypothetical protein